METRYISPEKFSKVSKGKKVIHYPNEWIKDVNGIRYHIVNPNMEYKISELEQKSYPWYLGMTFDDYSKTVKEMFGDDDARVFVLECDWFPTELVAGINNGRYKMYPFGPLLNVKFVRPKKDGTKSRREERAWWDFNPENVELLNDESC